MPCHWKRLLGCTQTRQSCLCSPPLSVFFHLVELLFVVVVDCLLDGADVIAQCAVALTPISGDDGGGFGTDELLLLQL